MGIANVRGEFDKVTGTVEYDPANPSASRIEASVDANTLSMRDPNRDGHVKGADFFDAANHPAITFTSKSVTSTGAGAFKVTGDLTLRGVTKEVSLAVTGLSANEQQDPWGNLRRGCEATARVKRQDFGMTFNAPLEGGAMMLGDDVDITMDMELMRKP
jgi:polyisoprenoid-binding protein YceI